jgi:hypothetical protein
MTYNIESLQQYSNVNVLDFGLLPKYLINFYFVPNSSDTAMACIQNHENF